MEKGQEKGDRTILILRFAKLHTSLKYVDSAMSGKSSHECFQGFLAPSKAYKILTG